MAEIPSYLQRPVEAVPQQNTAAVSFDDNAEPTIEVFDHENKAVIHAPESDVEHLLSTGQYTLKNGEVNVVGPDGASGTMPAQNIHKALAEGFRLETTAEKAKRELDEKYGDQEILATEAGLARSATFGLSDQLLTNLPKELGGLTPEQLRGIQEANPVASGLGEFGGLFAPTAAPIFKAGSLTEKAALKTLSKAGVQNKVAKSIVEKILPKAAGGAVEGTLIGAGQLISEDALGKADFNAENLMASTGYGALGGGAVGSLFGLASATAPLVTKAASIITDPLANMAKATADKSRNALELLGYTPNRITKLNEKNPKLVEELPDWLKNTVGLKHLDSSQTLMEKLQTVKKDSGEKIGELYDDVVKIYEANGQKGLTRREMNQDIAENIYQKIQKYENVPEMQAQVKPLQELYDNYIKMASNERLTARDLQAQRQMLDEALKFDKVPGTWTLKDEVGYDTRNIIRDKIFQMADNATALDKRATGIAAELKTANKSFSYATELEENLAKKIDKQQLIGFSDLVLGGVFGAGGKLGQAVAISKKFLDSDLKKKIVVLSDLEKANLKVADTINKSVSSFFNNTSKVVKPVSTAALLKYDLAADLQNETKKPKKADSRAKAYNNVVQNLQKYSEQPEAFIDRSNRKTASMYEHAPETSAALDATALKGIQFLQSKVPKRATQEGVFNILSKPLQPSTIDMAKFERYFEAVENPLSVIKDLENGTISNEGIETLKMVYPNIFSKVRESAIDYLTTKKPNLPYNKKIQLGLMLDIPSDTSLLPQNVMGLQSNFAPVGTEQQTGVEGMVNPTQGGMDKLSFDDRAKTGAETETL